MKSARILVVCEGLPVLSLIAGALESQGHRVIMAKDAPRAAAALGNKNFDLVIYKLPDRPQAAAVLQNLKPQTKLIILSEDPKLPEEAYRVEVAAYIFLPCRPAEIWRRIADCLAKMDFRPAPPKTKIRLHPVNQRVYQKLVSIFREMTTSVMSLSFQMEVLQDKVRERDDQELADLCHQARQRNQELFEIMKEIGDSFLKIKSSIRMEAWKSPRIEPLDPYRLQ